MKRIGILTAWMLFAATLGGWAQAYTVYFKENTSKDAQGNPATKPPLQAISIKKSGDQIVLTRQVGPGMVNDTIPLSAVSQIVFPEPPDIKAANDLLAQNQAEAALAKIEPIVAFFAEFRDLPGNRWPQAALAKCYALIALNREPQAEALITELNRTAGNDSDYARYAQVQLSGNYLKKQQYKQVIPLLEQVVKGTQNAQLLADAWIRKGSAHLALRQYEQALISFLHIPVLYAENKPLQPPALLGTARAYNGIEDFDRSVKTYDELIAQFSASPEAAAAKKELPKTKERLQQKLKQAEKDKAKG